MRADRAYPAGYHRDYLRGRGVRAAIPEKKDRAAHRIARDSKGGRPPKTDWGDYKQRHAIEYAFNRLKQSRAVATRYGKLACRYEATVLVAVRGHWLREVLVWRLLVLLGAFCAPAATRWCDERMKSGYGAETWNGRHLHAPDEQALTGLPAWISAR